MDKVSINYKKSTPHQVGKAYVQKVIFNKEAEHYEEWCSIANNINYSHYRLQFLSRVLRLNQNIANAPRVKAMYIYHWVRSGVLYKAYTW